MPPHERCKCGISVTYQLTELFPDLTVEQGVALNVLYGSRNKRSMDEAKEISRKYLEAVNFPEERYDWPIGKISIGERKRLKFAMSFAREPQVLLFDEIFPGLTEGEIKEYIWLLNWYIKEKNPAVLVVEHIMKVIMSICNRVIVMNHGKKIAEGVPEEVANNPDVICAYLGERYKLKR